MKEPFSIVSNLQTDYNLKLNFQNMDHHTGGKWLIHGTKHHKDNQRQSLEPPIEYPSRESKHGTKKSEGNMFNQYSKAMSRGGNIEEGAYLQNQNYLAQKV